MNNQSLREDFVQQLVWPVPQQSGIKISEFLKSSSSIACQNNDSNESVLQIPSDLIAFLFQCSELLEVETLVHFHAVHLLHKYLVKIMNGPQHQQKEVLDLQLIGMTCLLLSSKLYEKCQICTDNIIYLSNYSYTKKGKKLIKVMQFYYFCLRYPPNRIQEDQLLIDRAMIYLKLIEPLLPPQSFQHFVNFTIKVAELLYEDFLFVNNFKNLDLLSVGVIQCAAVILTKCTGNMPLTLRLSSYIRQEQETIISLSNQLLKRILKKEFLKNFSL